MCKALIILVLAELWLALIFNSNNAAVIKFTNVRCTSYNETWIKFHVCRLKAISRNKTVYNSNATMFYPAYQITITAQFLKKANGYKPWLYNITVDLCRFVKKPYNPVAIPIIRRIRDYTNFNHTCPYVGPQIVKGLHIPYHQLGFPFPGGEYLIKVDWYFHHRKQFSTDMYYSVDEGIMSSGQNRSIH